MNKCMSIIILLFGLSTFGCAHPHQEDTVLGNYVSQSETKLFHHRFKSEHRHIDFTGSQIAEINKLLGRNTGLAAVSYKKIYKKRGGNHIGAVIGNHYKVDKKTGSGKIVFLLGIHKGRIAEIEFPEGTSPVISRDLFTYFKGHTFKQFSDDLASLLKKGKLEDAGGAYSHKQHVTEEKYLEDMKQLRELEEKYTILSVIQEYLAVNTVIG